MQKHTVKLCKKLPHYLGNAEVKITSEKKMYTYVYIDAKTHSKAK